MFKLVMSQFGEQLYVLYLSRYFGVLTPRLYAVYNASNI